MRFPTMFLASAAMLPFVLVTAVHAAPPSGAQTVAPSAPAVTSNDSTNDVWDYGEFKPGARVYVMENAALLKEPHLKAKPVGAVTLKDGPLTILKKTTGWAMLFGVKDDFYEVRSGQTTGYIYAGWLAKATVEEDLDGDGVKETIRLGWKRRTGTEKTEYLPLVEARVVKAGQVVSSAVFNPVGLVENQRYGYSLRVKPLGSQGLSNSARLFRVSFEYGACDYPNGDALLVWANGSLQKGFTTVASGNEQGGVEVRWVFPNDRGGQPDRIVVIETLTNLNDAGKVIRRRESRRGVYRWDGKTLTEMSTATVAKRG